MKSRLVTALCLSALLPAVASATGIGDLYEVYGTNAGDQLGSSVDGVGDLNGDGYDDLVVGAPYGKVSGITKGYARVISSYDRSVLFQTDGVAILESRGHTVAGLRDLNNDGFREFAVASCPDNAAGTVRVFSGKTFINMITFTGASVGDWFGHSVSDAGDVNGDGTPDIAIGALLDDAGGASAGKVVVYSGATWSVIHTVLGAAGAQLGSAVAGCGDVNADGRADVVIGAWLDKNGGLQSGSARMISGMTGAALWTRFGATGSGYGWSLADFQNGNADAVRDVIVGAYLESTPSTSDAKGHAQVLNGVNGNVIRDHWGVGNNDAFGYTVAGVGDFDNDGMDDYAVCAVAEESVYAEVCGAIWVFSGPTGSWLMHNTGYEEFENFGIALAAAGDVNGNGSDDLVLGANGSDDWPLVGPGRIVTYTGVCGSWTNQGPGCPGAGGFVPFIGFATCLTPGGDFNLVVSNVNSPASVLLLVGTQQVNMQVLKSGCSLYVNPTVVIGPIPISPSSPSGPGNGFLAGLLQLPMNTPIITFGMQAFSIDAGAPHGFASSNALWATME